MSKPLYKIAEEIRAVEEMDPEGDADFAEALRNALDELNLDLHEKVDNTVKLVNHITHQCDAINDEILRLRTRHSLLLNRIKRIQSYIQDTLEKSGKDKYETDLFEVKIVKGRQVVKIDNEDELPNEYVRIKMDESPDKKAIAKAIGEGIEVPGCHMEKSPNSLRIK